MLSQRISPREQVGRHRRSYLAHGERGAINGMNPFSAPGSSRCIKRCRVQVKGTIMTEYFEI
jgi:hypothetical protein